MATIAYAPTRWLAQEWERAIPSAKVSGIVGDLAHKLRGGYHISREDQPSWNFSVAQFLADRRGPSDGSSAIDMNMSTAQMIIVTTRLHAAVKRRDPRIVKYVRAFNGTLNGKTAIRVEVKSGTVHWATPDHLWHVHLELYREFLNNMTAARAVLSVIKGEPLRSAPTMSLGESDKPVITSAVWSPNGKYGLKPGQPGKSRGVMFDEIHVAASSQANVLKELAALRGLVDALMRVVAGAVVDEAVLAELRAARETAAENNAELFAQLAQRDAALHALTSDIESLRERADEAADLREQVVNLSAALRAAGEELAKAQGQAG